MRILVLWADEHSTNLGVRVLAAGAKEAAQIAFPGSKVNNLHFGLGDPDGLLGGRSVARELTKRGGRLSEWLSSFDLIIDTRAGDSFTDIYGLKRHFIMSSVAELARIRRVPIVMSPQTIGPFNTAVGASLARRSARHAAGVYSRDSVSTEYSSARLGTRARQSSDLVFMLPDDRYLKPKRHDVLINVSGLLWATNPHTDYRAYRSLIFSLLEELSRSGREATLLAHVLNSADSDNDVPVVQSLARDQGLDLVVPQGLQDVRQTIASANVVVGARMHACLNALSQGVPAVAHAYSRKFNPLLENLGWRGTVDIRTDSDAMRATMDLLQDDQLASKASAVAKRGREDAEKFIQGMREAVS